MGFRFFVICGGNVGSRASLRSVSVIQLILRPVRPRARSATLRSAPTECDDLWRPIFQSAFMLTHLWFCLLKLYDVAQCKRSVEFRRRWTSVYQIHRGDHKWPHDKLFWSYERTFRAPKNFKSRVFFQLGSFVAIVRIPWGCLNGDKSVIFNALSTQWMAHAFRFRSLTRWWETLSNCVHKRKLFYPMILMSFHYSSRAEFTGWHDFLCLELRNSSPSPLP